MANSAAFCTSAKVDALTAITANADTLKMALFLASASLGAATTAYSTTGELAGTGNYTQGGVTLTHASAASSSGTTAIWTPTASAAWTSLTSSGSFDAALLYNASQTNRAICVFTFGAQSITNGNFTLTMPTNDASNALIRIA